MDNPPLSWPHIKMEWITRVKLLMRMIWMKVFNSGKLYYRQPEAFVCTTKKLSFGCIFYEMLSGDQLFERCSDSSTCEENDQEIDEGLLMMDSQIPNMLLENSLVKRSDSRLSASDLILRFLSLRSHLRRIFKINT